MRLTPLAAALVFAATGAVARDADDDLTPSNIRLTPLAAHGAVLTPLGSLDGTPASPAITNPRRTRDLAGRQADRAVDQRVQRAWRVPTASPILNIRPSG